MTRGLGKVVVALVVALIALLLFGRFAPHLMAQEQAGPPEAKARPLTQVEQQQVVIASQAIELWTAKRDHALSELQRAQESAQRLVTDVCGAGWSIDVRSMSCQPPSRGGGQ